MPKQAITLCRVRFFFVFVVKLKTIIWPIAKVTNKITSTVTTTFKVKLVSFIEINVIVTGLISTVKRETVLPDPAPITGWWAGTVCIFE